MAIVLLRATHDKLLKRIDKIESDISQNSKDIGEAASKGDLSENAEYDAAKERQSMLFQQLRHWEEFLGARIIEESSIKGDEVVYGTEVVAENQKNGKIETFQLVGSAEYELELYPNIMTYTSPLGQAMMNKKIGAYAKFDSRKGRIEYEIKEIRIIQSEMEE